MSRNAISPVKEMPRFHPLGVVKRDYLRAGASVLVACVLLLPVDANWGHRFSHPRRSQGCQNIVWHLRWKKQNNRSICLCSMHAHTQLPRPDSIRYRRNLHLPCVVQGSRACLECGMLGISPLGAELRAFILSQKLPSPWHFTLNSKLEKQYFWGMLELLEWLGPFFPGILCMHACSGSQSCPTPCSPMDCIPPGSSVLGTSQARILEWVAASFSRGSSWLRDRACISCIGRRILYLWVTWADLTVVCKSPRVHLGH